MITLYCSFLGLVNGLADGRVQPAVLDDPNNRFLFDGSPYRMADGYVSATSGAVEAAAALVVGCIGDNVAGICNRVGYLRTVLGERRFDFQIAADIEDLVGWPRGTFEVACSPNPAFDFPKIHVGDASARILQEVVDRVVVLGIGAKIKVV